MRHSLSSNARDFLSHARDVEQELGFGLFLSITCSEDLPFVHEKDVVVATHDTFLGDYRLRQQQAACNLWPRAKLPKGYRQPVKSSAPTLFVTGDLDGGTPLWFTDLSDFDTIFTALRPICSSKFMVIACTVNIMSTTLFHARQMSLALIVIAVVNHGRLETDHSGAGGGSSGLTRLGRDLMRLGGGENSAEVESTWTAARNRRNRGAFL